MNGQQSVKGVRTPLDADCMNTSRVRRIPIVAILDMHGKSPLFDKVVAQSLLLEACLPISAAWGLRTVVAFGLSVVARADLLSMAEVE